MANKITLKLLTHELECDEPNYDTLKKHGDKIMPFLEKLLKNKDPMMKAKATSLAMINSKKSIKIVEKVSRHKDISVYCAAAHGAQSTKVKDAESILMNLLSDLSPEVKFRALTAAGSNSTASIKNKVASMAKRIKRTHIKSTPRKF